jgi:hypothetical protein
MHWMSNQVIEEDPARLVLTCVRSRTARNTTDVMMMMMMMRMMMVHRCCSKWDKGGSPTATSMIVCAARPLHTKPTTSYLATSNLTTTTFTDGSVGT